MSIRIAVFILVGLLLSSWVQASLGGGGASVDADREALQGRMRVTARDHYTVHEIVEDGTRIREYSLSDGTVFAVSWRGVAQPDLSRILGSYYKEYLGALRRSRNRRSPSRRIIRSRHMVLVRSGHMRDVRGKAYVPSLMPKGFSPEDISG